MRSRIPVAAGAVLAAALALPGPAAAHTWKTWAGSPGKAPSNVPEGTQLNRFFPRVVKIRAGDRVTFRNNEFHTVTVLGRDGRSLPRIMAPDPAGGKYEGLNDAAGQLFHFNGLAKHIWNPEVFAPQGDTVVRGDGKTDSSGAYGGRNGKATFTFTRPGAYRVVCLVHPGMKGRIIVGPRRRSRAINEATARARIARQANRAWKSARRAAAVKVPAATVHAGAGDTATVLAFLPGTLTVKAGATVTFVHKSRSELHNMVFGEPKWVEAFLRETDLFPFGPGAPNQVSPVHVYGSDPLTGAGYDYDGANHSNGFLATPAMSTVPGVGPRAVRVTFRKPGVYRYFCAIHGPSMSGEIRVVE